MLAEVCMTAVVPPPLTLPVSTISWVLHSAFSIAGSALGPAILGAVCFYNLTNLLPPE